MVLGNPKCRPMVQEATPRSVVVDRLLISEVI
jgi:hypothetical protein